MNFYLLFISSAFLLCIFILVFFYKIGTKRSFQYLLSFLIPASLGGTAIHIGHFVLSNFRDITYYIAGITTIIFYLILSPVLLKTNSDRYSKISKLSKLFGCAIMLIYFWSIVSFGCFFVNMIYEKKLQPYQQIIQVITIPICLIWILPSENKLIGQERHNVGLTP